MSLYKRIIRPLLFKFDPETAHNLLALPAQLITIFSPLARLLTSHFSYTSPRLAIDIVGLKFKNPVGMAAGFDKNGKLFPLLAGLGFGFVESGTFTAHAQGGNPRPRIFRFPQSEALVNSMGFNNPGSVEVARVLTRQKRTIPRGINIGKSRRAELDDATEDYLNSLVRLASFGEYMAINISSPNTPGLRKLHEEKRLGELLSRLKSELKQSFADKPLFLKISPDLDDDELKQIIKTCFATGVNGIIISNTTLDKSSIPAAVDLNGGLSGRALRQRSSELISRAYQLSRGRLPIIGVGGVFSGADALEKIKAGASLIQVYTGLVYEGPALCYQINRYLDNYCHENGVQLQELIGLDHRT